MLKAGNLILRNHIFSLEIKYFCKLKELPWAELSPNYVSLFVGCFDKHIRGEALIFGLNLIASRPKFTRTRSPLLRPGFCVSPRAGWAGMELRGFGFGFWWGWAPLEHWQGTRFEVGAVITSSDSPQPLVTFLIDRAFVLSALGISSAGPAVILYFPQKA